MNLRSLIAKPLYGAYERRLLHKLDRSLLPHHVGVIHDGHRRFARAEGLPDLTAGYRMGMAKFVEFLHWCDDLEIQAVTCWLLSEQNLERPAEELAPYFDVLIELFEQIPNEAVSGNINVRFIGSLDLLPGPLVEAAKKLEDRCSTGSRRLTIALAYGGRREIVDATKDLVAKLAAEGCDANEMASHIDADAIASHLYTADLPDPDLVIRTSGEARLSGFLLWQSAYAEYVFVDVFWPAFRQIDFLRAIRDYTRRERRFGK